MNLLRDGREKMMKLINCIMLNHRLFWTNCKSTKLKYKHQKQINSSFYFKMKLVMIIDLSLFSRFYLICFFYQYLLHRLFDFLVALVIDIDETAFFVIVLMMMCAVIKFEAHAPGPEIILVKYSV